MKNIRIEESNEQKAQFVKVGTRNGKPLVRVYFNKRTEEREDEMGDEKKTYTVHIANFIERESEKDNALDVVKEEAIEQIEVYDTSEAVNSFTLQGKQMWLPKETRVGLMNSLNIEKAAGKTETVLWFGNESYILPIDTAMQMLSALELYALDCYNVTAAHKADIEALTTVEEVVAYDYTTDYPEKLNF